MKTTVRIEGLREIDAALGELPKASAKGVLRRVGKKALQLMAETARSLAPDDPATSGNDLRNSIVVGTKLNKAQSAKARKDQGRSFVTVYMGPTVPHGLFMEFGTAHHGPQPFMRPAWDRHKRGALEIVGRDLGDEIVKTAKRRAARAAKVAAKGGGQ